MILFKIRNASIQRMRISKYGTSLTLWGGIILIVLPELEKEEKKMYRSSILQNLRT